MKIQVRKWLIVVTTLFSLMFVVVGLEAKKGGKPGNPGDTSGEAAALNCELVDYLGGAPNTIPDTVLSDGDVLYMGGVDKVACGHGGTVQPNLSGISLNTVSKGAIKRAIRKIDLAFESCVEPDPDDPTCQYVPEALLWKDGTGGVVGMEDVWIGTGPYPDDETMDHIQLMAPGTHEMKFHMSPLGLADRFVIQLINREEFPPQLGQGGWCNLDQNEKFNWKDHAKTSEDITVCIWPDGDDGDSLPDGYTITTGDIEEDDCLSTSTRPVVSPRERVATICSTAGPLSCDGDMCNLLGWVPVQFTLHATYQ